MTILKTVAVAPEWECWRCKHKKAIMGESRVGNERENDQYINVEGQTHQQKLILGGSLTYMNIWSINLKI